MILRNSFDDYWQLSVVGPFSKRKKKQNENFQILSVLSISPPFSDMYLSKVHLFLNFELLLNIGGDEI